MHYYYSKGVDFFPSTEMIPVFTPDDGLVEVVKADAEPEFYYWPVCDEWQIMQCQHLGLNYIRGNHSHISEPQSFIRFHSPQAKVTVFFFFRALVLLIPGSQEDHTEMRALITSYMSHNADQFSLYLKGR